MEIAKTFLFFLFLRNSFLEQAPIEFDMIKHCNQDLMSAFGLDGMKFP